MVGAPLTTFFGVGAALGPQRRPGHVVVLDDEDVDLLEGVVDVGDLGLELLGAAPHELLEQGEQELVLAAEVLVEAAQRLAGALDDLLDGEVLAGVLGHQLHGRVEEALHSVLRAGAGRIERAGDGELTPRGGGVGGRGLGNRFLRHD